MNIERINNLRQQMAAYQLDGVALVPGPNLVYFSGIHAHLSERPIILFIPAVGEPVIVIPTLEAMKARAAGIPEERIFDWSDDVWFQGAFAAVADDLGLSDWKLGVETLYMRVLESQELLSCAPGLEIVSADALITTLRGAKDADEIAAMKQAVAVAEEAMNALLPVIRIGMSEKQIAGLLTQNLLDAGADAVSFDPIVASGPNSAIPHAVPTDRKIEEGDLLLFDWGALINGYASDLTRTFAIGEIDPQLQEIYEAVRLANEAGKSAVFPGAAAQEVDRAARGVIKEAGYGDFFFHRTGHGLGLEVHEEPSLKEGNSQPLRVGNVFTVEPGIYLEELGGVRIEDDVLVTEEGHQSLTSFPRELISLDLSI
ncbi:MAG: M24 family metallopeptidase [Candidatus Promineifilaceae bacterium]|jgi:Xaa-Pro dipeptidase